MDNLLLINVPCSQEFSGILGFGLKSLALDFSLILPVISRLLHPHSTDNKTSRLMVKGFSTVRDTQRFTVLHQEEESEEGDRREQKEKKRGIQERRDRSRQYSVP